MDYLAQKFERPKWVVKEYLYPDKISACAVTYCLRAPDDCLSFWSCELYQAQTIDDVILALASTMQELETIDIVLFRMDELASDRIEFAQQTDPRCPVADLSNRHFNALKLDLDKLASIAKRLAAKSRNNEDEHCIRFTRSRVKEIVTDAVNAGRIDRARLHKNLRPDQAGGT
jgi:hypothetical protein